MPGAVGGFDPVLLSRPPDPGSVNARSAARAFESLLVGRMLRNASQPIAGSTPLDGGPAGRLYRELFLEEVARLAAQRDGFGVARWIEARLATSEDRGDAGREEKQP